jgi:hypothetical protein
MDSKFTLFPIERIARNWLGIHEGNFDDSLLPLQVHGDVKLEDVSALISDDEFSYCKAALGTETTRHLETIKYAIIHRFPSIDKDPVTGELIFEQELAERSQRLVQEIVACLRLIRPTTQHAQLMGGSVQPDGTLKHFHFDNPFTFVSTLPNQKLFGVRTSDIQDLRLYAPLFVNAMEGNYWKFRMAVDMHQSGFFQHSHWKLRFFMWTAALESLFTTHTSSQHRGSLVAKERIKSLLGSGTLIYPPGDLSEYEPDPKLTVGDVIDEIYCLRNHIAHGDRVPDYYLQTPGRAGVNGPIFKAEVLMEAISSIVRQSLLTILKRGLLTHFADAAGSEAYFGSLGLTKGALQKMALPTFNCPN